MWINTRINEIGLTGKFKGRHVSWTIVLFENICWWKCFTTFDISLVLFVQQFWIMLCKHLNLSHQKMITFGVEKKTKISNPKLQKNSCDLTNFHKFIY